MGQVVLGFVGDVHVNREDPQDAFSAISSILALPDMLFANLEGAYTEEPQLLGPFRGFVCAPNRMLDIYGRIGFSVLSLANNHVADAGFDAMLDTREVLRRAGVATCGAGPTMAGAHEPAIVEVGGLRIAILAYASVFPVGWEAGADSPGIAAMRAYNTWRDPVRTLHMPGALPFVTTMPDSSDLDRLSVDIHLAAARADLVVVSFHWGDQARAFYLTDHERRTARHCIDHGAHMVVGHHHHALRGMEWYRGRPIMYGLGHFVFDLRWEWSDREEMNFRESDWGHYFRQIGYQSGPRKGWPLLPFPEDCRMTALAWATANESGIQDIGFLPALLSSDGRVHPLQPTSEEGRVVVDYLKKANQTQGLRTEFTDAGALELSEFRTLRVIPG